MDRFVAFVTVWTLALIGFVAVPALARSHDTFPGDFRRELKEVQAGEGQQATDGATA